MVFATDIPIYIQIAEDIKRNIIAGALPEGAKLPSVREYSSQYEVTIMTVQHALDQLLREGIITTRKGVGSFVVEGTAEELKSRLRAKYLTEFIANMRQTGLSPEEIVTCVEEAFK